MPASRAILFDIEQRNLSLSKRYSTLDKMGHLVKYVITEKEETVESAVESFTPDDKIILTKSDPIEVLPTTIHVNEQRVEKIVVEKAEKTEPVQTTPVTSKRRGRFKRKSDV